MKKLSLLFALAWSLTLAPIARATYWTDWTSYSLGQPGNAAGTLSDLGGPIQVSYSGDITTDTQVSTGTDDWSPNAPYLSAGVPNGPPAPDVIFLNGGVGTTQTITFSRPVSNPLLAIVGLGPASGQPEPFVFDHAFNVLSYGPGVFGGPGTLGTQAGNVLLGLEGSGVIQFPGSITSFSWTVPNMHSTTGFTVGQAPEPASLAILVLAIGACTLHQHAHQR